MQNNHNTNEWKSLGLFNDGDYLVYVFKKTEKIVAAIYLVTNLIKDNEPLKWEIREEAMTLLSSSISLNNDDQINKNVLSQAFFASSFELISLLNITQVAGLISPMNYSIISHEIEGVSQFLRNQSAEGVSRAGYILSDKFFSTDMPTPPQAQVKLSNIEERSKIIKKELEIKKIDVRDKKNSRQNTIVELLKKESKLTIKDFVRVIKDCSEKTIQRELIELVEKGVVKREGERRWSTYSLNLTF